jgi:hypothetical protein
MHFTGRSGASREDPVLNEAILEDPAASRLSVKS